jgi:hypothetical protein
MSFERFRGFVGDDEAISSQTCSATSSRFTDGRRHAAIPFFVHAGFCIARADWKTPVHDEMLVTPGEPQEVVESSVVVCMCRKLTEARWWTSARCARRDWCRGRPTRPGSRVRQARRLAGLTATSDGIELRRAQAAREKFVDLKLPDQGAEAPCRREEFDANSQCHGTERLD